MAELLEKFRSVRQLTEEIAKPLSPEDCVVQSMPDASPIRWHLAHTTWFFETFILKSRNDYQVFDDNFEYLFNSYYNAIGDQYPRSRRGLLTRPNQSQILDYRNHVDHQMVEAINRGEFSEQQCQQIVLGLNHEQQHQELMLTDLKHLLSLNSLYPNYRPGEMDETDEACSTWIGFESGVFETGYDGYQFCFDNELPRHKHYSEAFEVSEQLVTCGEYLEFMNAGGYSQPQHWLSLGWNQASEQGWNSPMYWKQIDDQWHVFTLNGWRLLDLDWPVCHVSYFEADAYARWRGKRLLGEQEWERACNEIQGETAKDCSQFANRLIAAEKVIHPTRTNQGMLGGVWEWTQSSYSPYPGFRPAAGAVGEYNGKFMCNQYVLRGGSVATPDDHIRSSYRNFFPPDTRWQFSGIRLGSP